MKPVVVLIIQCVSAAVVAKQQVEFLKFLVLKNFNFKFALWNISISWNLKNISFHEIWKHFISRNLKYFNIQFHETWNISISRNLKHFISRNLKHFNFTALWKWNISNSKLIGCEIFHETFHLILFWYLNLIIFR